MHLRAIKAAACCGLLVLAPTEAAPAGSWWNAYGGKAGKGRQGSKLEAVQARALPGGNDVPETDWKSWGKSDDELADEQEAAKKRKQDSAREREAQVEAEYEAFMRATGKLGEVNKTEEEGSASALGLKGGNPKALLLQLGKIGLILGVGYYGIKKVAARLSKSNKDGRKTTDIESVANAAGEAAEVVEVDTELEVDEEEEEEAAVEIEESSAGAEGGEEEQEELGAQAEEEEETEGLGRETGEEGEDEPSQEGEDEVDLTMV